VGIKPKQIHEREVGWRVRVEDAVLDVYFSTYIKFM
jgi:hypothetical protein